MLSVHGSIHHHERKIRTYGHWKAFALMYRRVNATFYKFINALTTLQTAGSNVKSHEAAYTVGEEEVSQ